jgi:hypothetical protein
MDDSLDNIIHEYDLKSLKESYGSEFTRSIADKYQNPTKILERETKQILIRYLDWSDIITEIVKEGTIYGSLPAGQFTVSVKGKESVIQELYKLIIINFY